MGKETVYEKAKRIVADGKVRRICRLEDGELYEVDGDSATYSVEISPYGIYCGCPARGRCSHEIAVFHTIQTGRR